MELRKESDTPDLTIRSTQLRHTGREIRKAGRGIRSAGKGAKRLGRGAKNLAKYGMLEKDQRAALSYLSAEQMRQWKSYRRPEQKKMFDNALRRVEKADRMQSTIGGSGSDAKRGKREFYRSEQIKKRRKKAAQNMGMRYRQSPVIKKATVAGEGWRNPPFSHERIKAARAAREREIGNNLGFALRRELSIVAPDHRYTVKGAEGKRGARRPDVVFYESDKRRAARKEKRIIRDQRKELKLEEKKKKVFRRTLGEMIDRDIRKQDQIKAARRQEQIDIMEHERDLYRQLGNTVFLLPRAGMAMLRQKVSAAVRRAAWGLLKLLAPILLPVFFVLLLILIVIGFIGGAGMESQQGYSASGYEIVEYAKQFVGVTKYVWGAGRNGGDDWQDYADCSSFVQGVFAHFGYQIGSTTYVQENHGTLVEDISVAVPGDIILFYSGGSPEHVGIYAGEGQMIHCSGGSSNYSPATAGRGVCWGNPDNDRRPYKIRRIVQDVVYGEGGYRPDPTVYSQQQLELIWAIVAQEDNGSYEGALAVISSAMNRTESSAWASCGSNALQQLMAPGQYCYSNDDYWRSRLGGNVPPYVKQAVGDCLEGGMRNHRFTSFRSRKGSQTGADAVQIGGNWYFGN